MADFITNNDLKHIPQGLNSIDPLDIAYGQKWDGRRSGLFSITDSAYVQANIDAQKKNRGDPRLKITYTDMEDKPFKNGYVEIGGKAYRTSADGVVEVVDEDRIERI